MHKNLFIGIIYREEELIWLNKYSKSVLQIAANNFQWSFIEGLEANLHKPIDVISTLSMGSYPLGSRKLFVQSKIFCKGKNSYFKYLGYINFYLIKGFCRFILLTLELIKWIKKNPNGNIYVYSLHSPYLWSLYFTKGYRQKNKIKYCLIVPDLVGKYAILDPIYTLSGIWERIDSFFLLKLSRNADCFVLLTKDMLEPLKIGNKPYTIIEGLTSPKALSLPKAKSLKNNIDSDKKIVVYAGSLLNVFGIQMLMDSFLKIHNKNYELWICGPKNESKTVIEYSQKDNRIRYLGFLRKTEISDVIDKATILINPRPNIGNYVKYSFPSKTMEYLLSGKPVLMFKLDGIPKDYYDHIYFIDNYNEFSISQAITFVCEKTEVELNDFGSRAKRFITERKNSKIQVKKAMLIIEKLKSTYTL
jgi:hypothetical protein